MTDLVFKVFSSFYYVVEDLFNLDNFKYLPALLANISTSFLVYVSLCIVAILITLSQWPKNKEEEKAKKSFDIGPEDEVTFQSLVSEEEIAKEIKRNTPGSYIPLDKNDAKNQLSAFLDKDVGESLASKSRKGRQAALRRKIEKGMTSEEQQTEQEIQRQQLEKIFSLLKEHESSLGKMSKEELDNQLKMYK